jgi:phospholipid/cholesterol/gamma-HCH transport system substrate-binding protein
METNVNYTIVGAFVIILFASIIFAIIWLSSGLSFEHYSTYMVYMKESVTGLNIDSPVEYNGVDVGLVKNIELNHKNPQLVELTLSIRSSTAITMGTQAMMATRGITGMTYIALKDKSTDLRPLVAEPGQPYPVIKTVPSIFLRLDTALSQLSINFHLITQSLQALLDKENLQSIKQTLFNLKVVTGSLASNSKKLDAIISNTSKASQQFTPLMQSSFGAMKILETQTLPAAYHVLNNLDSVSRTLSEISIELKQNPSMLIRGVQPAPLGPGETKRD